MNLPKFKNLQLLEEAFTHRSYLNENPQRNLVSNERLEFLGDAVLSFLVSKLLFQKFPRLPEGDLTNLRSAIVCTKTLCRTAKNLNLGEKLKLSRGEETSGGRNNPSLLANTFEAFLGALYLDQGIEEAENFLKTCLFPFLSEIIKSDSYKDFKSRFQEIVQEKAKISPVYKILKTIGPDHAKKFTVGVYVKEKLIGQGSGWSKQEAEQEAAKTALEK